ncbi:hypothetical protein [Rhodococcus opacus]|uniref:hypothetical protein n=1 Tax=Rhodococcus opacus TaxID=37919 RepID=UPI00080BA317|nr:hypothetical protein [Rhodococcus opacus]
MGIDVGANCLAVAQVLENTLDQIHSRFDRVLAHHLEQCWCPQLLAHEIAHQDHHFRCEHHAPVVRAPFPGTIAVIVGEFRSW